MQRGNQDALLSVDFGLKEWNEHSPKEIVRKYREFVYATGGKHSGVVLISTLFRCFSRDCFIEFPSLCSGQASQ